MSQQTIRTDQEYTRTARILNLVQQIAVQPKRWLRRDLADEYEISSRQLDNDFLIIRHGLKLPLRHSREGYYFEEIPKLPAVSYTFSEALALLLAANVAQTMPGIDSTDLAAAIARLQAIFPTEFRAHLRQFIQQGRQFSSDSPRQEKLRLLYEAMAFRRKVKVVYTVRSRDDEVTERVICPYHLLPYVRSWQVIAYCELRQSVRMFKVDRIQSGELLADLYTMPDDFDLDDYLGQGWGLMRGVASEPEAVILRFGAHAGSTVSEETWHRGKEKMDELPDGRWEMTLTVGITPEFIRWLLYYGDQVEVVQPHHLRVRVAEEHRRAAGMGDEQK